MQSPIKALLPTQRGFSIFCLFLLAISSFAQTATQFGLPGDIPVSADYDGDGVVDKAVFRPSNAVWYILQSSNGLTLAVQWGLPGDTPIAGDFDGDGAPDLTVFRNSNAIWYSYPNAWAKQQRPEFRVVETLPRACGENDPKSELFLGTDSFTFFLCDSAGNYVPLQMLQGLGGDPDWVSPTAISQ